MPHAFSYMKMMILIMILLGMAIICPSYAAESTVPLCKRLKVENLSQEQFICKNIRNINDLNDEVQQDWKRLKIINEKKGQFKIDDEIHGNFAYLEELDVSQVGELILNNNGFKDFTNLLTLNISHCQLEMLKGTHFNSESKLKDLDISWNYLQEVNFDLKLFNLESANFSHNSIKNINSDSWRTVQKLRSLHLDHNELKTANFHNYSELEILTLSDNEIEQLTTNSFSLMESMIELVITSNPLHHIADRTFESMSNLRILNLSANSLEKLSPQVFVGLGRILKLDLSSNDLKELSSFQFQYLVKLQHLDISRNSLTTISSANFNGLLNLRKLFIYENDITEVKSNTFANLNSIDTIDLSYNAIEYLGADIFGPFTLPRLKKLILKSNNIKKLEPLAFSSLPFLQYLSLGNNELNTLDVRMFAPMRRLEKLHLGNNQLETIPTEVLDSLTDLVEFLFDNNRLTFLSDTNGTFYKLAKVSLEGNPWQCPCLNELTEWLEDRQISYVRLQSPYYKGQKPLCVVTPVEVCVKNVNLAREHKIEEIFNKNN